MNPMRKMLLPCLLLLLLGNVYADQPKQNKRSIEDAVKQARKLHVAEANRISRLLYAMQTNPQQKQSLDEQHVVLNIRVDPQTQTVQGTVTIEFKPTALLSTLKLRLHQALHVTATTLDHTRIAITRNGSDLIFKLNPPLAKDSSHVISIDYNGSPPGSASISGGMFFDEHSGTPSATTLSEPFGSYNWWPCIDDLTDKFTADISLTVPPGMSGASNGRLLNVSNGANGWNTYHWQESYPISNYLISANVTNYAEFSSSYKSLDGKKNMPLRYYVYPEDLQQAMQNFQRIPEMIHTFAKMIGEYPFLNEKYGMVEFPWGGGMEHQTLTSISDNSAGMNDNYDFLFSHELAHQWFGDEITCATWNDIWLNEGFAMYFEILWSVHADHIAEGDIFSFYDDGEYNGHLGGSVYMYNGANPFSDSGAIYEKGAWVLHMLKYVMGPERFFKAIRTYRASHAYANASTEDLRAACEKIYGKPLNWFFDQWVYTARRPIYSMSYTQNGNSLNVTIDQTQPHRVVHRKVNADVYIMPMQLTVRFNDGTSQLFNVWNDKRQQNFVLQVSKTVTSVILDENHRILKVVQ
jgi:aminopeptidase N